MSEKCAPKPGINRDWRPAALVNATLFLNFWFYYLPGEPGSITDAAPLGAVVAAVQIPLLFFFGPAFAVQQTGLGLFTAIDHSLGTIPGYAVRLCSVAFLSLWMA